ncbi:MAG: hypothetical protein ACE5FC_05405 [Myxococcota bacterium]
MLPGFNHNVRFRGKMYHVQTEDSGADNPHIITVLYDGGEILARKRTSYADMVSSDHMEDVVRDLMKKQHKEMLRDLKAGTLKAKGAAEGTDAAAAAPMPKEAGSRKGRAAPPVADDPDEIILDFLTLEAGKKRPSGSSAH